MAREFLIKFPDIQFYEVQFSYTLTYHNGTEEPCHEPSSFVECMCVWVFGFGCVYVCVCVCMCLMWVCVGDGNECGCVWWVRVYV